jgi:hypothetical protein
MDAGTEWREGDGLGRGCGYADWEAERGAGFDQLCPFGAGNRREFAKGAPLAPDQPVIRPQGLLWGARDLEVLEDQVQALLQLLLRYAPVGGEADAAWAGVHYYSRLVQARFHFFWVL